MPTYLSSQNTGHLLKPKLSKFIEEEPATDKVQKRESYINFLQKLPPVLQNIDKIVQDELLTPLFLEKQKLQLKRGSQTPTHRRLLEDKDFQKQFKNTFKLTMRSNSHVEQRNAFINSVLANYGLSGKNEQKGTEQIRILTNQHKVKISQLQKRRERKISQPNGLQTLNQQQEIIRDIYQRQLDIKI